MICHDCDSPDCSWFAERNFIHFYRCNDCHEFTIGPDPYCVDFDESTMVMGTQSNTWTHPSDTYEIYGENEF